MIRGAATCQSNFCGAVENESESKPSQENTELSNLYDLHGSHVVVKDFLVIPINRKVLLFNVR